MMPHMANKSIIMLSDKIYNATEEFSVAYDENFLTEEFTSLSVNLRVDTCTPRVNGTFLSQLAPIGGYRRDFIHATAHETRQARSSACRAHCTPPWHRLGGNARYLLAPVHRPCMAGASFMKAPPTAPLDAPDPLRGPPCAPFSPAPGGPFGGTHTPLARFYATLGSPRRHRMVYRLYICSRTWKKC